MDPTLATSIQENLSIPCRADETVRELVRCIRYHFTKFVKPLQGGLLEQAQLGLGHSYSRSKVCYCSILVSKMYYCPCSADDQVHVVCECFAEQ
jgi:hypothetical protein